MRLRINFSSLKCVVGFLSTKVYCRCQILLLNYSEIIYYHKIQRKRFSLYTKSNLWHHAECSSQAKSFELSKDRLTIDKKKRGREDDVLLFCYSSSPSSSSSSSVNLQTSTPISLILPQTEHPSSLTWLFSLYPLVFCRQQQRTSSLR